MLVIHLPHWEGLVHLVARARRIANLDLDLDEPAAQFSADPMIGPMLRARPGSAPAGHVGSVRGRRPRDPRPAGDDRGGEHDRGPARRAARYAGAGAAASSASRTRSPAATVADADLDGLGLPRARQETIRSFARAVSEDAVRLDGSVGLDELVGSLTAIDGLGPWTANTLALRLGERDAFPATDLGLRRALDAPTVADRWRPWRALAAMHLWTAADTRERTAA